MIDMDLTFNMNEFGFGKGFDAKAVKMIGATAVGIIKERTQNKKLDPDGKRFLPYSSSYREFREKNGRNGSPVDLTFTGQMVGSTKVLSKSTKKKSFELIIGPSPSKRKIKTKGKGKSNKSRPSNNAIAFFLATANKPRNFVGLSEAEVERIGKEVSNMIIKGGLKFKVSKLILK